MQEGVVAERVIDDSMFRVVANHTYDWESWHGPDGRLIWVNDSVERMTGYRVDECHAMTDYPLPIVAERDRNRISRMLDEARAGTSCNDLEFAIVHRDGSERWMAISWQPMTDDSGVGLGFRTSVRDITYRQQLRKQLEAYSASLERQVEERTRRIAELEEHRRQMEKLAALAELAAGVAHEINNPLAGIRNAVALFADGLPQHHEHRELLRVVDAEIERISSIIHQMYRLYRHRPGAATDFVLEHTLDEVETLIAPTAARHGVTLRTDGPVLPTRVCLPVGEVKQILFNVIRNAVQASPPEATVLTRVRADEAWVHVDVIDEGCGMDDDVLPHIFEPFFTTKGHLREGIGLGLPLSRNLILAMGGRIDVTTAPGQGSTFRLTFPRRTDTGGARLET